MALKQNRARLSKGILEMKFMQRTKAKVDKEIEEAEGRAMYSSEITDKMNQNSNFIIEPSFMYCEGLIEGRLSYRGMNPEIERLLELEQEEKDKKTRPPPQANDVSDKDMQAFYENNLARTMQKKFDKKRKSNDNSKGGNKKLKFQKPKEDD
ncbi:M-phase phosphoprotein 6 [Episyrphus balteatus]|uniref:M-phase phosphoprotein 6 n=1 Tax=Episyrphus balteatus TaxID=286459 RepID=UPI002485D03B|nr:M-phase phosphoprotein 6 [Episyrphus balteatus]